MLQQARLWIEQARRIVALTGAGVSVESGIPTFRGDGGLWRKYRAEDLATPEAFDRDPRLVWEWYDWRRQIIAKASPNPAHRALAGCSRLTLITQNVDGLHDLGVRGMCGKSTAISGPCAVWTAARKLSIALRLWRCCLLSVRSAADRCALVLFGLAKTCLHASGRAPWMPRRRPMCF